MLSVGNTLGNSGAPSSLDARVAVGAGVFAVSNVEASAPEPQPRVITTPTQSPEQKIFAYNAYEFSYRSDFGKIILLQQNVETGQEVTQVPTEYHLRQYAATQRDQRIQLQQKLYKGSTGEAGAKSAAPDIVVTTTGAKPASGPSAPPAAPSVAPSTVAAATAAHVDIKA